MKKLRKLEIKKVTLRNLDEPLLNRVAGGNTTPTCVKSCGGTCFRAMTVVEGHVRRRWGNAALNARSAGDIERQSLQRQGLPTLNALLVRAEKLGDHSLTRFR